GDNDELLGDNDELLGDNDELLGDNDELLGDNDELLRDNDRMFVVNVKFTIRKNENTSKLYFKIKNEFTMARDYYLPRSDKDRADWLDNFAVKLLAYIYKYNITPEELQDVQNSAAYYRAVLNYLTHLNAHHRSVTQHKNALRNGLNVDKLLEPLVIAPFMFPAPVKSGIFTRVAALVNRIKTSLNYNEADGQDLGIIGVEKAQTTTDIKPVFTIRLVEGGYPEIVWKKRKMDGVEIWKQDADGNWHLVTRATTPNFIDRSPLPPPGMSEVRHYRIIYLRKDQPVGQWSNVVSVTVRG
ncbi:MAG: hypothetical protein ACK4TA_15445, partial [Saprospiraceae bacterium]